MLCTIFISNNKGEYLSKNGINSSAWQDSQDGLIEAAGYSVLGSWKSQSYPLSSFPGRIQKRPSNKFKIQLMWKLQGISEGSELWVSHPSQQTNPEKRKMCSLPIHYFYFLLGTEERQNAE